MGSFGSDGEFDFAGLRGECERRMDWDLIWGIQ